MYQQIHIKTPYQITNSDLTCKISLIGRYFFDAPDIVLAE